jgi:hypothetical protein
VHRDSRSQHEKNHERNEGLYGRRIEMDRSWTVYHVFTGVPADIGQGLMTGLSRADATDKMMSLNRRSVSGSRMRAASSPCTSMQGIQQS